MADHDITVRDGEPDFGELARFQQHAFASGSHDARRIALQSPAYYQWKYNTPVGVAKIATGRVGGVRVSHLAAIPSILSDGREEINAWQLCDIATRADVRRRGYFRRLLDVLLDSLPDADLVYCLPNARSLPLLAQAGFVRAGELRLWATVGPARASHAKVSSDIGLDEPMPARGARGRALVMRADPAYLDWRFARRPEAAYRRVTVRQGGETADAILRPLSIGRWRASMLMLMRGGETLQGALLRAAKGCAAADRARPLMYLSSMWGGSLSPLFLPVPKLLLPRSFPIVVRRPSPLPLDFCAGDWDVL